LALISVTASRNFEVYKRGIERSNVRISRDRSSADPVPTLRQAVSPTASFVPFAPARAIEFDARDPRGRKLRRPCRLTISPD
jgi:hypothetical protein